MNQHLPDRRDLYFTRLYYFVCLGGAGFIFPFLNLFYARQGLSGTQIGWVAALGSLVALVAAPFWTSHSERINNPRALLQATILLSALGYLWLSQQQVFAWIALVAALRVLVSAGIYPMSDSLVLSVTGGTKSGFGSVRVWASLGWAISVLFGGWLVEKTSLLAGFFGAILTLLAGALLLFPIQARYFSPPAIQHQPTQGLRAVVSSLRAKPIMLALGAMLVLVGLGNSGVLQFETIYLDTLGASEGVIGIASMVSAAVELPGMLWADRLVRKKSPYQLLQTAMLMYVPLRALVFLFPSVATILVERAIGGIAFSLYTIALVNSIARGTRPQETRTALALYNVTLASLVAIMANPLAGALYDLLGARWLYPFAILGYFLSWLILRRSAP
ncbi:MAG: MFS transporter [Chloroflexota bacterium]